MRFLQLFGAGKWAFNGHQEDKWELGHSDGWFAFPACIKVPDYFKYLYSIHIISLIFLCRRRRSLTSS